jgi:hypothetical protein
MITDIPGLTWATVPALVVRVSGISPTGRTILHRFPMMATGWLSNRNWKDRPFWWVSPSGEEKLSSGWQVKVIPHGMDLSRGDIFFPGKKKISAYMEELDRQHILTRWCNGGIISLR